jgi:hypothetical protein
MSAGDPLWKALGHMSNWYRLSQGSHSFKVSYRDEKRGELEIITTTADGTIVLFLEAGRSYNLESTEEGDKIRFNTKEIKHELPILTQEDAHLYEYGLREDDALRKALWWVDF